MTSATDPQSLERGPSAIARWAICSQLGDRGIADKEGFCKWCYVNKRTESWSSRDRHGGVTWLVECGSGRHALHHRYQICRVLNYELEEPVHR